MAFLTALLPIAEVTIQQPGGIPWEWFILKVFDFISVYGWRVVLFTVLLKLVLYPLDIFQRYKMRKNQRIQRSLEAETERLQKACGNDQKLFSSKQMELYRKHGYSYFSACLPMILTLVIFIWFFASLNNISQYMIMRQYAEWEQEYTAVYNEVIETKDAEGHDYNYYIELSGQEELSEDERAAAIDSANKIRAAAVEKGQQAVLDFYYGEGDYEGNQQKFLWIQNIWSPDVPWKKPILDYSGFKSAVSAWGTNASKSGLEESELTALMDEAHYNDVTGKLQADSRNAANGYLILPILAAGFSFLSQFLAQRQQKKMGQNQAGGGMKFMMFLFPIIMIVFAVGYTSAFSLYIVINSGMTILLNLLSTAIFAIKDKGSEKIAAATVVRYGRPDPNELLEREEKKSREKNKGGAGEETVVRYGRPDPHDTASLSDGGSKPEKGGKKRR